ncbi:MAG: GFA family protein [Polyangiaceae bacterium]
MEDTMVTGSCHCGKVQFEARIGAGPRIGRCNCTICRRTGSLGTIVKPAAFTLLAGEGSLATGRHDNWQAGPRSTPWPLRVAS